MGRQRRSEPAPQLFAPPSLRENPQSFRPAQCTCAEPHSDLRARTDRPLQTVPKRHEGPPRSSSPKAQPGQSRACNPTVKTAPSMGQPSPPSTRSGGRRSATPPLQLRQLPSEMTSKKTGRKRRHRRTGRRQALPRVDPLPGTISIRVRGDVQSLKQESSYFTLILPHRPSVKGGWPMAPCLNGIGHSASAAAAGPEPDSDNDDQSGERASASPFPSFTAWRMADLTCPSTRSRMQST